jgi:hypothetical protein
VKEDDDIMIVTGPSGKDERVEIVRSMEEYVVSVDEEDTGGTGNGKGRADDRLKGGFISIVIK